MRKTHPDGSIQTGLDRTKCWGSEAASHSRYTELSEGISDTAEWLHSLFHTRSSVTKPVNSFPAKQGIIQVSVFSLLNTQRNYYASPQWVQNVPIKHTHKQDEETSDLICKHMHIHKNVSINTKPHINENWPMLPSEISFQVVVKDCKL